MEHKFKREEGGSGPMAWIQPTCSCGWVGRKEYAYENYQYSNLREQADLHLGGVTEPYPEQQPSSNPSQLAPPVAWRISTPIGVLYTEDPYWVGEWQDAIYKVEPLYLSPSEQEHD
jgi:hypothetical protein